MAAGWVEGLRTLRFQSAFRHYEPLIRAATIVAGVVVPAVSFAIFAFLLPGRDLLDDTWVLFPLIIGVVSPAVFLTSHGVRHTVLLSPATIEYKELIRRQSVPTRAVSFVATIRHKHRELFAVRDPGGRSVVFGLGLSHEDFESIRSWFRSLAVALNLPFRENVPLLEAMTIFEPRGR